MLKLVLGLSLAAPLAAQGRPQPGDPELRAELTRLLQSGAIDQAVRRAQGALQNDPHNARIRREYAELHLSLARTWLAERRFEDSLTALDAVLAAEPAHAAALRLRRNILAIREKAGEHIADIPPLLRLELFDTALDRIKEIRALRPDLNDALVSSERAAWLGAADDHYLAGNFPEAFALYERLTANGAEDTHDVRARQALSLALALAETGLSQPLDSTAVTRLSALATGEPTGPADPRVARVVAGLLAERTGRILEAGQAYAAAIDEAWQLPPTDRRAASVERLRRAAIERLRAMYAATPTHRRGGAWLMTLPDAWKHRQTAHFDVYARNDLIAERVADAAEFHLAGIAEWLGLDVQMNWGPRCELRVHAIAADLQNATGVRGTTRSVSRTRVQAERVLSRRLDVVQADPLLLNTTLPNELTHLLLTTTGATGSTPPAIIEGLALQAEPPARRLLMRRNLPDVCPDPTTLLAGPDPEINGGPASGRSEPALGTGSTESVPDQPLRFYADCDALTGLLLHRLATHSAQGGGTEPRPSRSGARDAPVTALLAVFHSSISDNWWRAFGWEDEAAMRTTWETWHTARRNPPRMPLMILNAPVAEQPPENRP